MDTIVALMTPPGRSATAVLRLSGERAKEVASNIFTKPLQNRKAVLGYIVNERGEKLDQSLVTYFAAPGSYTGEDVVEISLHGSPVLADAVCRLVPGVLGDEECFTDESHWDGTLEYPQYSRPEEWHGRKVPAVLLSGHHGNVADWRKKESYKRTMERRPDMFAKFDERKLTTKHDRKVLAEAKAEFAAEQAAKLAESAE